MALALTPEMILVLGLVGFTMLMLVLEWIRADMVALLVVVVIGLTGLIPSDRVFNGFAGNAVIAIIAIMIMGAGLDRAGVLSLTANFVMRVSFLLSGPSCRDVASSGRVPDGPAVARLASSRRSTRPITSKCTH